MNLSAWSLLMVACVFGGSTLCAGERLEERSFSTRGVATLKIDCYRALLIVDSAEENVVRVQVSASTGLEDPELSARVLQALILDWRQTGDVIALVARDPRESVRFSWQENQKLDLVIKVTIPRPCHLDLVTGNGSIRLGDITGDVRLKTGDGTVFCRMVAGSIAVRNGQGDIIVSRCSGDIDLVTQHGNIRAGTIGGKAALKAVNGDIELYSARQGLSLETNHGSVAVGIPRQFSGTASIKANGGNVRLKIDPRASVAVDASTSWGRVRKVSATQLPLSLVIESGGFDRRSLVAKLNGGGPLIQARAAGGYVELVGETPPFME